MIFYISMNNGGHTPLHWASQHKNIVLNNEHIDVHALNYNGKTPLHLATGKKIEDLIIRYQEGKNIN